jgi:Mg-chelatase subunit ChlD
MGKAKSSNGSTAANRTLLVLVVDRSGSMASIREDMEGGIATLLGEQRHEAGECLVTLAQFDTEYELVWDRLPIAEAKSYRLVPRGSTALLDAMGRTMAVTAERIAAMGEGERPGTVVFVVVTDGLENSSVEWTHPQVTEAVQRHMEKDGWQFTFLGANQDAIAEGGRVGVAAASSLTYDATAAGVSASMAAASSAIGRVRRGEDRSLRYSEADRQAATRR